MVLSSAWNIITITIRMLNFFFPVTVIHTKMGIHIHILFMVWNCLQFVFLHSQYSELYLSYGLNKYLLKELIWVKIMYSCFIYNYIYMCVGGCMCVCVGVCMCNINKNVVKFPLGFSYWKNFYFIKTLVEWVNPVQWNDELWEVDNQSLVCVGLTKIFT